jgi:hypothetical protein
MNLIGNVMSIKLRLTIMNFLIFLFGNMVDSLGGYMGQFLVQMKEEPLWLIDG